MITSRKGRAELLEGHQREKDYSIPYGKGHLSFKLPPNLKVSVLRPKPSPAVEDELKEIETALGQPIGNSRLEAIKPGQKIAVVVSDLSRPVPHRLLLQPLLRKLDSLGVPRSTIKILIASGQHPKVPPDHFRGLVDPAWSMGIEVTSHDPVENLVYVGGTSRGTPVWINRTFMESDVRILTGMIDPHQFVGFTGGVKLAAIGLAGVKTIEANHSMLTHPAARLGEIEGNPVREDIDEIGRMLGISFILNVVLNEENRIVKAFAGDSLEAWQEGVHLCKHLSGVPLTGKVDLVIASQGGYPKDIDLYQVQKGLAHAVRALRPGGIVVLAGECSEGIGDEVFLEVMEHAKSPEEVISLFQSTGFKMGLHKAFLLCRSLVQHRVYFCSGLSASEATKFFLTPVSSLQGGISEALRHLPPNPTVAIMPKASSTFVLAPLLL